MNPAKGLSNRCYADNPRVQQEPDDAQFDRSAKRWWRKPLVVVDGKHLPAELAVLGAEPNRGEAGAWLNSRGVQSATVGFAVDSFGHFKTVRAPLPKFVVTVSKPCTERSTRRRAPQI